MSSLSDYEFFTVEVPGIDVRVNDPFRLKIYEILVEPITDLPVRVELPPLIPIYPPLVDVDVKLAYLEEISYTGVGFDDVLTAIPTIPDIYVNLPENNESLLEERLREILRVTLSTSPEKKPIEVKPLLVKDVPEDIRDRYTIKLKIRALTPEIKEIIENRLTKEFRITRLVKRMEVVRDPRYLYELEILLRQIEAMMGLRGRASRRSRKAP